MMQLTKTADRNSEVRHNSYPQKGQIILFYGDN